MRFAIYCSEVGSLSWQKRLIDEGHEVLVYLDFTNHENKQPQRRVGDGIVPKTTNREQWVTWGHGGIYLFDSSSHGSFAERLRNSGELVIGSGEFCDRLEGDREWGFTIARSVGMAIPKYVPFDSVPDAVAKLKKLKGKQYFKTDKYVEATATTSGEPDELSDYLSTFFQPQYGSRFSGILQEQMEGFALSTARWWNGNSFVGPYEGTIEHKKFMDGDKGPATSCSFNLLWFYGDDEPPIAQALGFAKLEAIWRQNNAPPGQYDINALLSEDDGEPYFLEWTPRMGYDAAPTEQKGINDLGSFLSALAHGRDIEKFFERKQMLGSVRLTVSPYPSEHIDLEHKDSAFRHPVRNTDGLWSGRFIAYGLAHDAGELYVADPAGQVGLASGAGQDVDLFRGIYDWLDDELKIKDLQYRTDAEERCKEDLRTIARLGYTTR